ncbi:MAG: YciI family protein [Litorimonas sp.]
MTHAAIQKAERVPRLAQHTWLVTCLDGPDTPPLRNEHLFGHLDHIEANNGDYRVAGPIRETPEGPIIGSVFLIPADSAEDAVKTMEGDPYISSGMYASITALHFAPACGDWMGGVIWDQDEIRANMQKYV